MFSSFHPLIIIFGLPKSACSTTDMSKGGISKIKDKLNSGMQLLDKEKPKKQIPDTVQGTSKLSQTEAQQSTSRYRSFV